MSVGFSPQNEAFLNEQITSGVYPDRQQALDAAVSLLREQASVLKRIDLSRQQLDAGDWAEYDESTLSARFSELKARVSRNSSDRV